MRYLNEQLKYGYTEEQLEELIKSVGGFGHDTITYDRYSKVLDKKVKARRAGGIWSIDLIICKYLNL